MAKFTGHTITSDSALGSAVIERSLRFDANSNTRLVRTIGSTSNRRTYTYSWWLKRSYESAEQYIWYVGASSGTPYLDARFEASSHELQIQDYTPSRPIRFITNRKFRDCTSWMHFVFAVDTTQGTASNRAKLYINGEQETSFSTETYPDQNYDSSANVSGHIQVWGTNKASTSNDLDGYLAEAIFIDGQQLTPDNFGYTEPLTGIWRPKEYEGTYGTNGFHLDFSDNSSTTAATLGKDTSGNGNNFTPSNFGGTNVDAVLDTPINNFITLNPLHRFTHNCTLSNGNLKATGPNQNFPGTAANIALSSGKWYYEFQINTKTSVPMCGVIKNNYVSGGAGRILYRSGGHYVMHDGAEPTDPDAYDVGDIIGVAIDLDDTAGNIRFYKNGTLQTVNAALNNVKAHLSISTLGGVYPYIQMYHNDVCTVNFGQTPFTHTPPTGFRALSYKNLTTPRGDSIVDPRDHFDTLLYTGNGGNKTVTGLQFKPDFAWIKSLSDGHHPSWTDSVRGMLKTLSSTRNDIAEYNESAGLNEFLHNGLGFNGNNYYSVNVNGANFVAWCWKGGGSSGTYNIDGVGYATAAAAGLNGGTITPTGTSINTISGLSIIAYTGNGTNGASMSHGLPSAPKIMFHRSRGQGRNWYTITTALDGSADYWYLNNTNAPGNSAVTAPTSDLMYFTSSQESNNNGENYIVYAFCDIPGFLKMGTYTGNGSNDGPYVHLGFRPAWIMIRKSSGTEDWVIYDNKRDIDNIVGFRIYADIANAAASNASDLDFLSDGFKHRKNSGLTNGSSTYFYMAFAEQPGRTPYMSPSNAR